MTRRELAKRWDISFDTVKRLINSGELKLGSPQVNDMNQAVVKSIDLEEVERFEKLKRIPKDPISYPTVKKLTGMSSQLIYYYLSYGAIRTAVKINNRTTIFSKKEILQLRKLKNGS